MLHLPSKKLDSITDEVGELHPLLNLLFRKLPHVEDSEYTHGRDEMGADFVLALKHDVFDTIDHVGVIAKVGRITQDHTDIERQITECGVLRFFQGGKQEIHIREIWVITTKHITHGAQRKIYTNYPTRKILFIDGPRLEKLIDEHVPTAWSQLALPVGEYLHDLRTRLEEEDKRFSLVPTSGRSVYVKQDLYQLPDPEYRRNQKGRPPKRLALDDVGKQRHTYIEGGIGSGKSKLIRRLASSRAEPSSYATSKLLPLVVSYNDLMNTHAGDLQRVVDSLVPGEVRDLQSHAEYLVYVDAFDERKLDQDDHAAALTYLFDQATKESRIRVIVTSRHIRGLESKNSLPPSILRCELRHLSMEKVIEFLSKLCDRLSTSSRTIEDLKKSSLFKNLPRSPISAILLARLLDENSQDIPSNMTELYSKYMEQTLGRWDIEKGLQSQKEYQALDQLMMALARQMIDDQRSFLSVSEAKQAFAQYLGTRNLGLDVDALFARMIERCDIMVPQHGLDDGRL